MTLGAGLDSKDIGRLDPGPRRFLRLVDALTSARLLPTPEKFLRRPPEKRELALPALLTGRPPEGVTIKDVQIETDGGSLPGRFYEPAGGGILPALVYLHGGGWIGGGVRTADKICAELAAQGRVRVLSVGYRLSPESAYPGPLDDAAAALLWIVENAAQLRIDPDAVGVAGDSAGGNLAAALAIRARDADLPPLRFQALLYPALDGTLSTASMKSFDGLSLKRSSMATFYDAYAGTTDRTDPLLSPLHLPSAAGLPPAVVITSGFDCLRDEGRLYADKLRAAGVRVEHQHYPDAAHGFLGLAGLGRQAGPAFQVLGRAVREFLHETHAAP